MIRTKKAGLLTKVVVLALLIYMATALLNLQGQIQEAQAQRDTLSQQVAEQTQINAELAEDVANPDDPDHPSERRVFCPPAGRRFPPGSAGTPAGERLPGGKVLRRGAHGPYSDKP